MFMPESVDLHEVGPGDPYGWLMSEPMVWSGTFRRTPHRLEVPASTTQPFSTDLASVPRSLTWLFPRYGKYTKAAVLHDYLCQNFSDTPPTATDPPSVLPLADRSDADEMFLLFMKELGVPRLRRWLMWGAVSWATIITALLPGRRSNPFRWIARIFGVLALGTLAVVMIVEHDDLAAIVTSSVAVSAVLLIGGIVAIGRADRVLPYVLVYILTLLFAPLIGIGVVLGLVLYGYLFVEDVFAGLPATRKFVRDLFSPEAKLAKLATPQFARIAAIIES